MRIESDKGDNIYNAIKKAKAELRRGNRTEWEDSEDSKYARYHEKVTLVFNEVEVDISTDSNVDDIAIIYNLKSEMLRLTR